MEYGVLIPDFLVPPGISWLSICHCSCFSWYSGDTVCKPHRRGQGMQCVCKPRMPEEIFCSYFSLVCYFPPTFHLGFESTLHEVVCSDSQYLSLIRAWNGDRLLCLLEVWRRYFPEVNRSHLSTVLKRLEIDTQIPTSQQTNLLRVAGIISVRSVLTLSVPSNFLLFNYCIVCFDCRGAPGRLVKLSDARRLLDDLSIPLQIGSFKPENKVLYTFTLV